MFFANDPYSNSTPFSIFLILTHVQSLNNCLLPWCCWCHACVWHHQAPIIWPHTPLAHACWQQIRPWRAASSSFWRCKRVCWEGRIVLSGDLSTWIHKRWDCFHDCFDGNFNIVNRKNLVAGEEPGNSAKSLLAGKKIVIPGPAQEIPAKKGMSCSSS